MKDRACVFRAATIEEADIVVAWLSEQGIEAFVRDRFVIATGYLALAAAPRGVAVCVLDVDQADKARELLALHAAQRKGRVPSGRPGKFLRVTCDHCGHMADFPSELYGSVQNCPHYQANVDVSEPPALC